VKATSSSLVIIVNECFSKCRVCLCSRKTRM